MGLIGGMARVAVVSGTATAVSNRVSRRQANRWSQQGQPEPAYLAPQPTQPPPQYAEPAPAPAAPAPDPYALLRELANLKQQGVLSEAEFEVEKAKILATT